MSAQAYSGGESLGTRGYMCMETVSDLRPLGPPASYFESAVAQMAHS